MVKPSRESCTQSQWSNQSWELHTITMVKPCRERCTQSPWPNQSWELHAINCQGLLEGICLVWTFSLNSPLPADILEGCFWVVHFKHLSLSWCDPVPSTGPWKSKNKYNTQINETVKTQSIMTVCKMLFFFHLAYLSRSGNSNCIHFRETTCALLHIEDGQISRYHMTNPARTAIMGSFSWRKPSSEGKERDHSACANVYSDHVPNQKGLVCWKMLGVL